MDEEELEAVLAHEIGHHKLGHIPKMIGLAGVSVFVMFSVWGWLAGAPWFVEGFGFDASTVGEIVPVLLLLDAEWLVTFGLRRFRATFRRHEYEADAFARDAMGSTLPLSRALRKLHKENLSNLTPHPLYSSFHYSHPTLLEREAE